MRTKLLTLALLFSSLLAGSALAQPAPPLAPPSALPSVPVKMSTRLITSQCS